MGRKDFNSGGKMERWGEERGGDAGWGNGWENGEGVEESILGKGNRRKSKVMKMEGWMDGENKIKNKEEGEGKRVSRKKIE